ncbi:response regulator [Clostridioides sp. ES-S-0048-02]|uniref:response regulator n=1 Tax=Clostridioides sp. ES-S-0048-02 TaxID=2770777 RepID=UPI001D128E9D|nr:response regulator [Clostridioides sp. ES-S-0048-02]
MNEQMNIVSEHPYTVSVAIGDVKANLTLLRALPERLSYSQTSDVITGIKTHYSSIDKSMTELINLLDDRYLADKQSVPAMRSLYSQLYNDQIKMLKMAESQNNTQEDIEAYFSKEIQPKLDKLDALSVTITEGAGRKLNEYSELVTSSKRVMVIMGSILSVSVLIAIIFYQYILRLKYKSEEEMNSALAELEVEQRANLAKSQFLFNMSHDIRTPMNAIIGLTVIAAMDIDKKDKVKDCLTKILSSSRHMLGLINDVLDMSRIESGKVSLNDEDFKLPELIDDFISITYPQAIEKDIQMEINVSDISHEKVIGDALQINRIMTNIIGNSLKFTQPGGKIGLTIRELPPTTKGYGSYQFIMRDTGIGMSEDFIKKIFQPFERAETSTKSRVEGTGLGMAITKNIVDMMGGQIQIESELGKGTTFIVTIPIKLQTCEEETFDYSKLYDLRSLVVDDDEIACENTVRIIQEIGMNCEWVLSGIEAVEKTKMAHEINQDYHVVIIDWKMPVMDGLQTTRQIRKIVGDELPIIVLTAYDWADIEEEAKAAGINAFLSKPVFKSRLYHIMSNLTSSEKTKEAANVNVAESKKTYSGRVLIVEDNEINMDIAEEFISYFGVTTEKVWNGLEAVDRIKTVEPGYYDLVFMDIQMPKMDGYEATQQIRKLEKENNMNHLPIVAMSANAFIEEVNKGYACGMDNYITKPIELEKLNTCFKKYLKSTL